jgi:hypothetical protein
MTGTQTSFLHQIIPFYVSPILQKEANVIELL